MTDRVRPPLPEAVLAAIVRSAGDAIYTTDPAGIVTSWNPACELLFGYSEAEMVGRGLDVLRVDDDLERDALDRRRARALGEGRPAHDPHETRRRRKNRAVIEVAITVSELLDENGISVGSVAIARDISGRRRIESQLEYLANHDGLTGLFNRRRFEEELTAACARADRDGSTGAVLLIDLDNFKYVNDTFGHHAGDALLTSVAAALSRRVRAADTLARLGGDEFGVLIARSSLEDAKTLAGDLVELIRDHVLEVDGHAIRTTASIGVVGVDGRSEAAEVLLADVDRAMYESKRSGRDRATARAASAR